MSRQIIKAKHLDIKRTEKDTRTKKQMKNGIYTKTAFSVSRVSAKAGSWQPVFALTARRVGVAVSHLDGSRTRSRGRPTSQAARAASLKPAAVATPVCVTERRPAGARGAPSVAPAPALRAPPENLGLHPDGLNHKRSGRFCCEPKLEDCGTQGPGVAPCRVS